MYASISITITISIATTTVYKYNEWVITIWIVTQVSCLFTTY